MKTERKVGKARKLNRTKVLDLHARGFSAPEIAQQQGVNHSTVWRFLERMKPELGAVEAFKKGRADVFARIQAKSLDTQERIIDTLDDELLRALTPSQKSGLIIALNAQAGTLFDKERLERGQSSHNVSIITAMLDAAHDKLYKPVKQPVAAASSQNDGNSAGTQDPSEVNVSID